MECYAARMAFLVNKSQNCYLEIARVRNRARDQIEHTTKHENHVQSYLGKLLRVLLNQLPAHLPGVCTQYLRVTRRYRDVCQFH